MAISLFGNEGRLMKCFEMKTRGKANSKLSKNKRYILRTSSLGKRDGSSLGRVEGSSVGDIEGASVGVMEGKSVLPFPDASRSSFSAFAVLLTPPFFLVGFVFSSSCFQLTTSVSPC